MNCTRLLEPATDCAIARASEVLPVPGHVVEQQVTLAEERREGEPHDPVLAEQHLLDRADESVEVRGEPRRLLGGHRHRCSSLIGSSSGRSRPRPQHPTRRGRRPSRSGIWQRGRPTARSCRCRRRRRRSGTLAGSPEFSGAAVHDQVFVGSSHTRLGSANVSDGLRVRGQDLRPRTAAAPDRAAAHLESRRLAERPVEQGPQPPRAAKLGAAGRSARRSRRPRRSAGAVAAGVHAGDVAVPGLLVHPRPCRSAPRSRAPGDGRTTVPATSVFTHAARL